MVAAAVVLSSAAKAETLSASLVQIGPQNGVTWQIDLTNSSASALTNAEITSFTLTQVAGAAGTPVSLSTLPVSVGTIPANGSATASLLFDFTGLAQTSLFDLTATLVGDGFSASIAFDNEEPYQYCGSLGPDGVVRCPGTVTFSTTTPLPASFVLLGSILVVLGLLLPTLYAWRSARLATSSMQR